MQRTADSCQDGKEYDRLLAEAVKLGRQHETKAKYFIPRMYEALVKIEGVTPFDAADRIYKDVLGIWQKDTVRRLLPPEAKDQAARERQVLSRMHMPPVSAGLILRKETTLAGASAEAIAAAPEHHLNMDEGKPGSPLEQENVLLRKELVELKSAKSSLIERLSRVERLLAEQQEQEKSKQQNHSSQIRGTTKEEGEIVTILLPPSLFMKTYALVRSSSKPLLLRVKAGEAIDIDKTSKPN